MPSETTANIIQKTKELNDFYSTIQSIHDQSRRINRNFWEHFIIQLAKISKINWRFKNIIRSKIECS